MTEGVGLDHAKTIRNRGRFAPGTAPGPGRPPKVTETQYLEVTITNCSLDDWGKIVRKAVEDAIAGDFQARNWLSKTLIGDKVRISSEVSVTYPDGPESQYRPYSKETGLLIEKAIAAMGSEN